MKDFSANHYTCNEYREEMILLGLQRRLAAKNITVEEKEQVRKEIQAVEARMGLD